MSYVRWASKVRSGCGKCADVAVECVQAALEEWRDE